MVAGEASGDLLAAAVLRGIRAREPAMSLAGIGGPCMREAGFKAWHDAHELAVHGYADALRAYPRLSALRRHLARRLEHERPALFVGVDAPDFNLGLETRLRRAGIPTAHFVGPSVWAWRAGRMKGIAQAVDRMLVLFPFEPALYRAAGVPVSYVGHPLADAIPLQVDRVGARQALLSDAGEAPVVALLPGSRAGEVRHMGRVFLEAAAWMLARRAGLRFVLPAATPALRAAITGVLDGRDGGTPLPAALRERLTLTDGGSHAVLAACDAVLVASGTATLEAALFRRPMVIAYRMAPLSWQIMRRMRLQPWVGLPNILARETLVPEFLQHEATPVALGAALLTQIDDEAGRARLAERFEAMHRELRQDCASRAAEVLLDMAQGRVPA